MKITRTILALSAAAAVAGTATAQEGRQLDTIADPTEVQFVDSVGGAPFGVGQVVGIFWDARCAQVEYTFNSNAGANIGTGAEISPEVLAGVVQEGLDRWNDIPTSYIEMDITAIEDLGNRPRVAGDFINEVTFITDPSFGALASSPSTALLADSTFAPGDDLDGDGDSDVFDPAVEGINKCSDVDNDGDIEFPAGDYVAGTILDNDVQFGAGVFWELGATDTGGADVDAVSTHEFGHSHGHNHSLINQISTADGTGSTMFPFIDTTDSASELGSRSLSKDDIAVSSFIYPEGSGTSGITALQPGDIAFDDAYDILEGSVTRDGGPILGAHVSAITRNKKQTVTGTYSGSSVVFFDLFGVTPTPGGLFAFEESAIDGNWSLPVPKNRTYLIAVESLDGDPAAPGNISTNAIIGGILGQNDLPEEQFDAPSESNIEFRPDQGIAVASRSPQASDIDFIANEEIVQRNADAIDFIGTGALAAAADTFLYAQSFDRDDVLARLALGDVPISMNFRTGTLDASFVPRFYSAQLAVGFANEDGTATITETISQKFDIVGQDGDSTPVVLGKRRKIAGQIIKALDKDPALQVFTLLEARVSELPVGPSGFPPAFLALDIDTTGQSYQSIDGGPLELRGGNWDIELRYVNAGE
ncbi:MAG: matrixin family metalloprotease [Pseudomonadota bacterium]